MRPIVIVAICLGLPLCGCDAQSVAPSAYAEAFKVQIHQAEANRKIDGLESRVSELERTRALDEKRIAELEARADR